MASFVIVDDIVTLELSKLEKFEALHGSMSMPRSAISAVRAVPDGMNELHGLRMPGTGIPGLLMVGTLRSGDLLTFAVCHARRPAVVVDLTGQEYDRLVVSADDAEEVVARLTAGR
jgi:hypothetical protein